MSGSYNNRYSSPDSENMRKKLQILFLTERGTMFCEGGANAMSSYANFSFCDDLYNRYSLLAKTNEIVFR